VSLAHNGVLFLDEMPEFRRRVLEVLRQPLEEGHVTISRVRGTLRLPARFQLVGAMNPCPCGRAGHGGCLCSPRQVQGYVGRLSGPLLDRIDLHVEVPPLSWRDMTSPPGEPSARVRARVEAAWERQRRRGQDQEGRCGNAQLSGDRLREAAGLDSQGESLLELAVERRGLSGRAVDRLLRVARTLADLAASDRVSGDQVAEALQLRRCESDTVPMG
jgi:magnesium chelatase family protein